MRAAASQELGLRRVPGWVDRAARAACAAQLRPKPMRQRLPTLITKNLVKVFKQRILTYADLSYLMRDLGVLRPWGATVSGTSRRDGRCRGCGRLSPPAYFMGEPLV